MNYERCEFLVQELQKALVINGDGTNLKLLDEEEIIDFDELDKLFFQKNSKGAREDLVDILSVLKENGIE